jgi:hypothetical protein
MKKALILASILSVVLLFIFSCELESDSGNSSRGVDALKLTETDITGWTEDEGGGTYNSETLFDFINGGAPKYINNGLIEGFIQYMSKSDRKATIMVMDFGTESNAIAMYNDMSNRNSSKEKAGNYNLNTAQLDVSPSSGVDAYAHFKQFYIELNLTDFPDKSEAPNVAASIIEVFEAKINQLK